MQYAEGDPRVSGMSQRPLPFHQEPSPRGVRFQNQPLGAAGNVVRDTAVKGDTTAFEKYTRLPSGQHYSVDTTLARVSYKLYRSRHLAYVTVGANGEDDVALGRPRLAVRYSNIVRDLSKIGDGHALFAGQRGKLIVIG